jgi:HAMP domain-containing protein
MILVTTLNAELARIDRAITALNHRRFAALARCDNALAARYQREIKSLKRCREELIYGEPLIKM